MEIIYSKVSLFFRLLYSDHQCWTWDYEDNFFLVSFCDKHDVLCDVCHLVLN